MTAVRANIPTFDKRQFSTKANIVITQESEKIMKKNREAILNHTCRRLSRAEIAKMRWVVEGLHLIHKGLPYVKEGLAHVVTLEKYGAAVKVPKTPHEETLSCFYILSGQVEVTYAGRGNDIVYTYGAGSFLGLVSLDGPEKYMEPPLGIFTLEFCEFLRIDRARFHETLNGLSKQKSKEKMEYLNTTCILNQLPCSFKESLVPYLIKQVFLPESLIMQQGKVPEHIYFVVKGSCQYYRMLYLPETKKDEIFKLGDIKTGHFFGESLIDGLPNKYNVTAVGTVVCYLIKRLDFNSIAKRHLVAMLREKRVQIASDEELLKHGNENIQWQSFKRQQVRLRLKESGNSKLLLGSNNSNVRWRPASSKRESPKQLFLERRLPRPKTAYAGDKQVSSMYIQTGSNSPEFEDDDEILVFGDRDSGDGKYNYNAAFVKRFHGYEKVNMEESGPPEARDMWKEWQEGQRIMKEMSKRESTRYTFNPQHLYASRQDYFIFDSDASNLEIPTHYVQKYQRPNKIEIETEDDQPSAIIEANRSSTLQMVAARLRTNILKRQMAAYQKKRIWEEKRREKLGLHSVNTDADIIEESKICNNVEQSENEENPADNVEMERDSFQSLSNDITESCQNIVTVAADNELGPAKPNRNTDTKPQTIKEISHKNQTTKKRVHKNKSNIFRSSTIHIPVERKSGHVHWERQTKTFRRDKHSASATIKSIKFQ